ncbi:MAG TPA: dTMP kinase [Xanthomonadales bacterium]|nr:dTMP kinase [Xanthomonadales bacterium]
MKRGLFVTFEGGEGAGKSTAIAAAGEVLARHGIQYRLTREPGGTPLGEALRSLVLDPANSGTCREAEVLMMCAARAQHVVDVISPALASGLWVLSDRFADATWAYQGGGRGVDFELISVLERYTTFGLKPDRTILLDVSVDEGMRRVARRGAEPDRMEREEQTFFERVRTAYRGRAAGETGRFRVVDASLPLGEVAAQVADELDSLARAWSR